MESHNGTDSKTSSKGNKRRNFFQRGILSRTSNPPQLCVDPTELQRVSFATSIDDLPDRPSAFQQVLSQIKTNAISTPKSVFRMTRLQNLRKLSKDNRSLSPQNVNVTGTSSSPTPRVVDTLLHVQTRPRSSSNASTSGAAADITFSADPKEPDLIVAVGFSILFIAFNNIELTLFSLKIINSLIIFVINAAATCKMRCILKLHKNEMCYGVKQKLFPAYDFDFS